MANKKRGLGRGLESLLSSASVNLEDSADESGAVENGQLSNLPVDLIKPGKYQPRQDFDQEALNELADSIRAQGVVQPIVVRPVGEGKEYEIIAGERRWRATQLAGLHEIPAVIREVPDQAAIAMALIENIQREDLNPLEEARALARLIDEFDMTHQQVSEAVGRSRTAVTNLLRLLDLTPEVKEMLEHAQLDMGHGRALLALDGAQQIHAARLVASKGSSVRETERLVKRMVAEEHAPPEVKPKVDPNIRNLEQDLSERLGAKAQIQHTPKGGGKLVIHYGSVDELDGILAHIK